MPDIRTQLEAQAGAAPGPASEAAPAAEPKPPVKRSYRRKYRKMRVAFEEKMTLSNNLIKDECKAVALARRLQEQNDQMLDLLLDINDAARIPGHLRFDLRSPSPSESVVPSLEADTDPDPIAIQTALREAREELVTGQLSPEEFARIESTLSSRTLALGPRTLSKLAASTPHTSQPPAHLDDLHLGDNAPGYLSPNHEEEYLLAADAALMDPSVYDPQSRDGRPLRLATHAQLPTDKELSLRNPDSVYNWLRKNQPQVFLQDKDPHHAENASEKSSAKPGGGGHRGKRPSAVSTSTPGPKTEQDALDDEIGFIPEAGAAGAKRGKNKDDEPYRPKGGSSRPPKRKRDDGEAVVKGPRKKSRASGGQGGSGGGS
ncbi:uncharacterized protein BDZ99DRAFT_568810 [Mytilinidion resinicola]|uniref:IEC3 subunit of the Ino80 complex, chromatin re-modelling-domain-containing protein n=1 Tax=Mytilinidion resinicola TaxID=574789 RepID=A0A6A6YVN3_9PEZI|nr:uncharacterized protein BDZ99DRAFT_568810 [Mytilinidion resinicola]KAF2812054.1 hypothetical protein BDZ99DRAFT_568810 [Mytilinidion resinicola]